MSALVFGTSILILLLEFLKLLGFFTLEPFDLFGLLNRLIFSVCSPMKA